MRITFFKVASASTVAVLSVFALSTGRGAAAASLFETAIHGPADPQSGANADDSAIPAPSITASPSTNLRIVDNGLNAALALDSQLVREQSVESVLGSLGYTLAPEDVVYPARQDAAPMFGTIFVSRAPGVVVVADGKTRAVKTRATTVAALLVERGITLDDNDEVEPAREHAIEPNLRVSVTRVELKEETETETIAFDTTTKEDGSLYEGETSVQTAGVVGERQLTYQITTKNGREVSRERTTEKILKEPVTQVVLQGTKPRPPQATTGPYLETVNAAAAEFGIDGKELMRVMLCESNGNANSAAYDNKGKLLYGGLFQFSPSMWGESWNPWRGSSLFDPTASIYAAAKAWSLGMRGRWGC